MHFKRTPLLSFSTPKPKPPGDSCRRTRPYSAVFFITSIMTVFMPSGCDDMGTWM